MKPLHSYFAGTELGMLMRNSLWMFLGQGISVVAQAGYFIVIARLLGSLEYGMFVGAAASVSMLSQYGSFGSGLLFLRYVSPDHSRFAMYWGNILLSTFTFGTLLVVALGAVSPWLLHGIDARMIALLAIGDCICSQLTTAISQVFQTFEKMKYTALLNLATTCTRMLLAMALLLTLHRTNALTWAITSLVISLLTAGAGAITVTRHFGLPEFSPRLFLARAREGFLFAVSGSTTSIYNDVDKAMLAHFGMNAANGIYTMAYKVVDIGTMPIRSVHAAAFPRFFRQGAGPDGLAATAPLARRLLSRTSLLGLAMAALMFVFAPAIPVFVGRGFLPSVSALRWLCMIPFLRSFHLAAGDALSGAGKQAFRLTFQMIAAAANVALNLLLIPSYSWRGAAWASVATDGILGLFLWGVIAWMKSRNRARVGAQSAGLEPAVTLEV
jgi:O-antigen/teichoic acid export membrane protein